MKKRETRMEHLVDPTLTRDLNKEIYPGTAEDPRALQLRELGVLNGTAPTNVTSQASSDIGGLLKLTQILPGTNSTPLDQYIQQTRLQHLAENDHEAFMKEMDTFGTGESLGYDGECGTQGEEEWKVDSGFSSWKNATGEKIPLPSDLFPTEQEKVDLSPSRPDPFPFVLSGSSAEQQKADLSPSRPDPFPFVLSGSRHTRTTRSGRGKGGKGLGKGGAKRHRKVLNDDIQEEEDEDGEEEESTMSGRGRGGKGFISSDDIQGITKPTIGCRARQGGVEPVKAGKPSNLFDRIPNLFFHVVWVSYILDFLAKCIKFQC